MKTHDTPRTPGYPCWFDLFTPDPEKVVPFYEAVFPWEIRDLGPEMNHYRIGYVDGRAAAGMGELPSGAKYRPAWMIHFAAQDVAAQAEIARGLGGVVLMEPHRVPGQGRFVILRDPTGAEFALWEAEANVGAEISEAPGAMRWCEVNTRDSDRAKAFYEVLLNAEAVLMETPGTTYYQLMQGDAPLAGILQMTKEWEGVDPHWMPYFQVQDATSAAEAAKAANGSVAVPPFDTPFGRIAVLSDPAGAHFSIMESPAA